MKPFLTLLFCIACLGCKSGYKLVGINNKEAPADLVPQFTEGPPTLVYKTRADYRDRVLVFLSEDKQRVVSFPQPTDLQSEKGTSRMPVVLHDGYLIDNRGIAPNAAYLRLTYEEYARLPAVPSPEALSDMILDKDPLTTLCDCGNRTAFADPEKQLNAWIDQKKLPSACKVLK